MKAQLYTAKHYMSVCAHYAGAAGLVAAAVVVAQPWLVATAAVLVGGIQYAAVRVQRRFFETKLRQHADAHPDAPKLGEIARDLYLRSGLSATHFPIYDFAADARKMANDNTKGTDRMMAKAMSRMAAIPNAAAVRVGKPVIMISTPLLKLLYDAEEKAVLAHEFAHAAARHHHVTAPIGFMIGTAAMSMVGVLVGALIGAGLTGVVAGLVTAATAGAVVKNVYAKVIGKSRVLKRKKEELASFDDIAASKKLEGAGKIASTITEIGVVSLFNPVYALAYGAMEAVGRSGKLLAMSLSRHHEFQADRGAVELGADPLALITALRKITLVSERSMQAAFSGEMPKKGALTAAWQKANETHPHVQRRVARLADMARQQKRSEADIEGAVNGVLPVDHTHVLPLDVVRAIALR